MTPYYWALRQHHEGSVLHLTETALKKGGRYATLCAPSAGGVIWPASERNVRFKKRCARCASILARSGRRTLPEPETDYAASRHSAIDALSVVRLAGGFRYAIQAEIIKPFDSNLAKRIREISDTYSSDMARIRPRIDEVLEQLRRKRDNATEEEVR